MNADLAIDLATAQDAQRFGALGSIWHSPELSTRPYTGRCRLRRSVANDRDTFLNRIQSQAATAGVTLMHTANSSRWRDSARPSSRPRRFFIQPSAKARTP